MSRSKSRSNRHPVLRYGMSVLTIVVLFALQAVPEIARTPNIAVLVIYAAILVSAWYGGLGPGLLTTALIGLLVLPGSLTAWRLVRLALFVCGGVLVSLLIEALHAARRRAEAASQKAQEHLDSLRENEARLRLLIESVRDYALFTTDADGRITGWNPGAERVLGYTEAEVLGREIALFFTPEEIGDGVPEAELRTALAEGRAEHDRWHVRRDGTRFWSSGIVAPLRDESVPGFILVLRDVTEQKSAEDERARLLAGEQAARREAEAANRAKDEFLAVLSHELRTPLTPVLAATSALLKSTTLSPEARSVLELTRSHVGLEARLIDDLLDVTRINRGELRLEREVVDAHVLVHRAVALCREPIDAAGLPLELDLKAAAHHVEADPTRLQQVFWNLLRNAAKFTPAGGRLIVRSRPEGDATAGRLLVEVSDTGIGIEPDLLPVIFDAFRQGEALAMRRFGGLGLGLAISKALVEAHGGRLTASSAGTGRGATFTVELAAVAPAKAVTGSPSDRQDLAPDGRSLRILLVEDDSSTQRVLARLLRARRCAVTTAGSVAEALGASETGEFDLIVSDVGLPDGTGWDLMQQLRERGIARGIALTGFGMEEDVRRSREAGFATHLTKPIDFQKLELAIQRVAAAS
jgi:PAS domain S-box-containing protein